MCERRVDRHAHDLVPRVEDYWVDSRIGDSPNEHGLHPFTFHINVFMEFPPNYQDGGVNWQCETLTDEEKGDAFYELQDTIHENWNDKLWLGPRSRAHRSRYHGFACGISLHNVGPRHRDQAHLIMKVLVNPRTAETIRRHSLPEAERLRLPPEPRFERAHCQIGGYSTAGTRSRVDMVIAWGSYFNPRDASTQYDVEGLFPTSDRGQQRFVQSRAAHELGHYLKLHHPGWATTHEDASPASYLHGGTLDQQNALMSTGNEMHAEYGVPWVERLQSHHYHCGVVYEPHLDPAGYQRWRGR